MACLISPVAVCPAQKTRPGTFVAGPGSISKKFLIVNCALLTLTIVRLGRELLAGNELARHVADVM